MTLPKNEWPWTLDDAVAAKITLWDGGKLGVVYHYPDEAIQMHAIGSEDWPTIRRLKRAGKIEYQRESRLAAFVDPSVDEVDHGERLGIQAQ